MEKISGAVEKVLYISVGTYAEYIAELCDYPKDSIDFVVPFNVFEQLHQEDLIDEDIWEIYTYDDIVEIVAQW